ncbi:MAG TPA: hypothetical protein VK211_12870 [Kamptonema sp.]|nr:hypothetical protein [Kamptonema sp.]
MVFYQTLVSGGVILPTDGVSISESNLIKAQRYVYEKNPGLKLTIVGSSIAETINPKDIGSEVSSLALGKGACQTGLEILKRTKLTPTIVLVEINETITRKIDKDLIDSVYHPFFYWLRGSLSILREEYRPLSIFIDYLENRSNSIIKLTREEQDRQEMRYTNPDLSKYSIQTEVDRESKSLSEKDIEIIAAESDYIKAQIAEIKKNGSVRLVLFDMPREPIVDRGIRRKQVGVLMKKLFPPDTFEWLSPPPAREWRTNDGIHLILTDVQDYALFLREQLF